MATTVEFTVSSDVKLHCASCEQRVDRALRRVPGVQEVAANAATQQVVATIDAGQVSPSELQAKCAELGYQVTSQTGAR